MGHLLGQALFGLVVGAIAKVIMPGQDPGGMMVTHAHRTGRGHAWNVRRSDALGWR